MIFTSRKLEKALAKGEVTGWNAAQYYFVPMIIHSVLTTPIWLTRPRYYIYPTPAIHVTIYGLQILAGVLVYCGIKKCFKSNDQIDSRDFISRMVILGFPVLIKVTVLTYIASLILLIFIVSRLSEVFVTALYPLMTYVSFKLINDSLIRLGNEIQDSQQSNSG